MKGTIITIAVDGTISVEALDHPRILEKAQKAVGGDIQIVPYLNTLQIDKAVGLDVRGLPADVIENPTPCISFCNEEGKLHGLPLNRTASGLWLDAIVRGGHIPKPAPGTYPLDDVLVGNVVFLVGDQEFMEAL